MTPPVCWSPARRSSAVAVVVALLWLLAPVAVASAHAYLLASTPPGGYAVPTAPTAVSVDFDQPVTIGHDPLRLSDAAGTAHDLGPARLSLDGRRLSAPMPSPLSDGGYRVRWEVTADDGDVVSGVITFTVGAGAAAPDASGGSGVESPVVVVARWALFAGLAVALGGLLGDRLVRRVLREADAASAPRPRPAVLAGAALGGVAAVVLALAQVGGDSARLVSTGPGRVLGVEAVAFAVALVLGGLGWRRRREPLGAAAGVVLLAVVLAEGVRAHPHAQSPLWGTALTAIHLLAATVWIGTLLHVLRVARHWRGHPGWTRLLVHDYARLAFAAVAVVIATGTAEALIVLPTAAALIGTPYGLILMGKVVLLAGILVLAMLGRRRLRTATADHAGTPIGHPVRVEAAALVAVLALTAVLVSVPPPGPIVAELPAPPPPSGTAVTVGTLAGQVTVIATASSGQLVIRMTRPGRDDLGTDNASPAADPGGGVDRGSSAANYQLSVQLSLPGDPVATALTMRGCGAGCFTTPTSWRAGIAELHVQVAAAPASGGTATLDVAWPPRTDPTLLPAVVAAMRAVPHMTVHQAVTSDYTGFPGNETPIVISGAEFLGQEPYSSGGGEVVVLASRPEETELGLGFPGGIAIRLVVGAEHRILREEETAPNHLITSTFEYPSTS